MTSKLPRYTRLSKCLTAEDCRPPITRKVGDLVWTENRLRMTFYGHASYFTLNKSNCDTIIEVFKSRETDNWNGKYIEIFTAPMQHEGRTIDVLYARRPSRSGISKEAHRLKKAFNL
jgi:hypothetical protein